MNQAYPAAWIAQYESFLRSQVILGADYPNSEYRMVQAKDGSWAFLLLDPQSLAKAQYARQRLAAICRRGTRRVEAGCMLPAIVTQESEAETL